MSDYNKIADDELVLLLKRGDPLAFAALYNRYQGLLYIYASKIARDFDIAEDLVQELFVYLWEKRDTIQFNRSVSSFLYTSIRYRFLNLVDKQVVRSDYARSFQLFLDKGEFSVDNYIEEKELNRIIEAEIDNLPSKMREIFLLSRRLNLKNLEIAERLGISEKTVKNQLSLALKLLRERLGLVNFIYLYFFFK